MKRAWAEERGRDEVGRAATRARPPTPLFDATVTVAGGALVRVRVSFLGPFFHLGFAFRGDKGEVQVCGGNGRENPEIFVPIVFFSPVSNPLPLFLRRSFPPRLPDVVHPAFRLGADTSTPECDYSTSLKPFYFE